MDSKPQPPAPPQPMPETVDEIRAGLRLANAIYWAVYGDSLLRNGGVK